MKTKSGLHSNNIHRNGYDLEGLIDSYPALQDFTLKNKYGNLSVDFSNPKAVRALNAALLKKYYGIIDWVFPEENLCPPIPGRVDYIHHLNDLIKDIATGNDVTILDIGTGATCIYPLLGAKVYDWNFVAIDIELDSLDYAQDIIDDNDLDTKIELRQQFDEQNVVDDILEEGDSFTAAMCNPPFYASAEEARGANRRKTKNLGTNAVRNFSGNSNELWYPGGEKAFLHNYLYQSSLHKEVCIWYTSLVSKKENVESLKKSASKLGATSFKVILMEQGNKVTRIVAWSFQK